MTFCTDESFDVNGPKKPEAGNYRAKFEGLSNPEKNERGEYRIWTFKDDKNQTYTGWTGASGATPKNKLGRFLMGLSNKPLEKATNIKPIDYVGSEYLLIFAPNQEGNISLQTISQVQG